MIDTTSPVNTRPAQAQVAVRWVAFFEALKGLVVLAGVTGVLALVHHDLHGLLVRLMAHTHLNPASHAPGVLLHAVDLVQGGSVRWVALGALAYAGLRLLEAWGLYRDRAWAEWLAASSGAIYVPFEVWELVRDPGWLSLSMLLLNLAVVAVILRSQSRRQAGWMASRLPR